jgi:hypothetical protein
MSGPEIYRIDNVNRAQELSKQIDAVTKQLTELKKEYNRLTGNGPMRLFPSYSYLHIYDVEFCKGYLIHDMIKIGPSACGGSTYEFSGKTYAGCNDTKVIVHTNDDDEIIIINMGTRFSWNELDSCYYCSYHCSSHMCKERHHFESDINNLAKIYRDEYTDFDIDSCRSSISELDNDVLDVSKPEYCKNPKIKKLIKKMTKKKTTNDHEKKKDKSTKEKKLTIQNVISAGVREYDYGSDIHSDACADYYEDLDEKVHVESNCYVIDGPFTYKNPDTYYRDELEHNAWHEALYENDFSDDYCEYCDQHYHISDSD